MKTNPLFCRPVKFYLDGRSNITIRNILAANRLVKIHLHVITRRPALPQPTPAPKPQPEPQLDAAYLSALDIRAAIDREVSTRLQERQPELKGRVVQRVKATYEDIRANIEHLKHEQSYQHAQIGERQ